MIGTYNSALLDNAVSALSRLPGIGEKTALRLALFLLRQPENVAQAIGDSVVKLRTEITYCRRCHNISEASLCAICSDVHREKDIVCVVENVKDVIAIEATHQFRGLYHVLGGLISPVDGVAPSDLEIDSLVERVASENVKEVILALSPTMEGDTTGYYIYRRLEGTGAEVTVLARGLSIGGEIEYADELTLGRSIIGRMPFEKDGHTDGKAYQVTGC